MSDLFNEEIISQATHTKWAGKTVHFARETDSTNLWGKRAWREEGAGHGELFVAEYQSAGRGRFTRRWSAPPDSAITMSILICPEFSPQKAPMLTLVMGLSVAQAVAELGLEVGIKWPNDVLVNGKKIAGILSESVIQGTKFKGLVLGVGINLNATDEGVKSITDKEVTALNLELKKEVVYKDFLNKLLDEFFKNYDKFLKNGFIFIKDDYISRNSFLGKDLKVQVLNRIEEGLATSITDNGELILKRDNKEFVLTIGDIL